MRHPHCPLPAPDSTAVAVADACDAYGACCLDPEKQSRQNEAAYGPNDGLPVVVGGGAGSTSFGASHMQNLQDRQLPSGHWGLKCNKSVC